MRGLIKKYDKAAKFDIQTVFFEYFNRTEVKQAIADRNREQLAKGKDSNDIDLDSIAGGYTAFTIEYKKEFGRGLGAVTDRVTLYDRGDFHKGIIVLVTKDEITIIGTDPKTEELKRDWGKDIIGINDTSLQEIIDNFKTHLLEVIRGQVL